jgi:RecB family exonuclease
VVEPALKDYRPTERAYSVSTIEAYVECPYRFFLKGIMELYPMDRPEPPQRMEADIKGEIFHRVQAELLSNPEQDLDEVLARIGAEAAEEHKPAVMQVWNEELRRMRADLQGWLARLDPQWTVVATEKDFDVTVHGYKLKGRADLIEEHKTTGQRRVTDHKTGSVPDKPPRLQAALYALALEAPVARLYYATLKANYKSIQVHCSNLPLEVLEAIDAAVDSGLLVANPREDACMYCDYRPICGPYEEQRVRRKPKDDTLIRLRKL